MINVLMCGSVLSVKGGMVSVVKNYLNYKDWSPSICRSDRRARA